MDDLLSACVVMICGYQDAPGICDDSVAWVNLLHCAISDELIRILDPIPNVMPNTFYQCRFLLTISTTLMTYYTLYNSPLFLSVRPPRPTC